MEFIRDRNGVIIMTVVDSGYESQTSNSISANLLYDILQELKELNKEIKKITNNIELKENYNTSNKPTMLITIPKFDTY